MRYSWVGWWLRGLGIRRWIGCQGLCLGAVGPLDLIWFVGLGGGVGACCLVNAEHGFLQMPSKVIGRCINGVVLAGFNG